MAINYTPGQILHIESSMGPWSYISFLRCTKPGNRVDESYALHTCCDLCIDPYDSNCLTLARGNGSLLDNDTSFENIREATNEEKVVLLDALVKAFKDHDLGWDKYFTDSTYDDIRDWLAWEFDVDLDELSDNINAGDNDPLVDTIYEITNYIWDILCKETDNYQACTDYIEPEMVNKQEFIKKAVEWVRNRDNAEKYLHIRTSLIDDFADALRKYLEE